MPRQIIDKSSVLEFIKRAEKPVSRDDIVKATGYSGDFRYCIKVLKQEHDEIQSIGPKNNTAYVWKPVKALFSEVKNHEGYNDFTAGKAIANVMKSSGNGKYPMRQEFGEVWSTSMTIDDMEGLLIISAKEGTCICYNVYPHKKSFMKDGFTMRWTDNIGTHYISAINPINVQEKKLTKRLYEIGTAEKECLKTYLMNALSIDIPASTKIVTVEKEVEKIVEKPVEVIKEVPVEVEKIVEVEKQVEVYRTDPKEIEMAVLKAKCEIYERLLFKENPQKLQVI